MSTTSGPLSGDNVEAMVLRPSDSGLQGTTLNLYFDTVSPSGEQEGLIAAGTPFIIRWGTPQTSPGTTLTDPVFTGVTVSSTTAGSVKSTDGTEKVVIK